MIVDKRKPAFSNCYHSTLAVLLVVHAHFVGLAPAVMALEGVGCFTARISRLWNLERLQLSA